ncbi:MAG: hypothetical protein KF750_00010 [Xanthobacteraceae bacterium]|nr:hypothetical protein [Xanthobacteraceae bacterium]
MTTFEMMVIATAGYVAALMVLLAVAGAHEGTERLRNTISRFDIGGSDASR